MSFKVISESGNSRTVDSRAEAEEVKEDMEGLGMDVEIQSVESDGGTAAERLAEETGEPQEKFESDADMPEFDDLESVPQEPSVTEDPVSWMPDHFVDTIQGVPTVNRKGYAVIASKYGVSVTAEPVTLPSETDFEYAEFKAVATTEDGREYSGFGSAHVDRQDGDDSHLLAELAETRAMKRATAWATGVGMTAVEELKHEL